MKQHILFIPGVSGRTWPWQHQIDHLADIVTCQVIVLENQTTRKEMADCVLADAPERFALAGYSLGGRVAQYAARAATGVYRGNEAVADAVTAREESLI